MMQMLAHKSQFLLVEGADDIKLYAKFVDRKFCLLIDCVGRDNAKDAIRVLLERGVDKAIALVDDDYNSMLGEIVGENIFVTDANDAEMMLVCSPALDSYLRERLEDAKWETFKEANIPTPRNLYLDRASRIGALRLALKRLVARANFKDISWDFLNQISLEHDHSRLIDSVFSCNSVTLGLAGITPLSLKQFGEAELASGGQELRKLCRGHDVTRIIGISLKSAVGSCHPQTVTQLEVEAGLRMSYHWEDFKKTRLFENLLAWQSAKGRILAVA